ncbi:MAG: DUF4982 domain-containing protein [Prevotella sp.]|nr:DUF4982 domain-containing protein [Prevotella sp.]
MNRKLLFVVVLALSAMQATAQVSFGQPERFNEQWLFNLESTDATTSKTTPAEVAFEDTRWRRLNLPHDWSVEGVMSPHLASCTGYLPGGIGWYRKHFATPAAKDDFVKTFIYFEGVYNRSEVYLNGHLLGKRPNGYASFLYDMTPYLNKEGEDNVLAVRVDHSQYADSRWYTGSGIYRDVWLIRAPETHLAQWGSAWRLKKISNSQAIVEVDIETEGKGALGIPAEVIMTDASGKEVARAKATLGCPGKKTVTLTVKKPHRWNLDDTYLYNIETRLGNGDRSLMRAGLRTLTFDPNHGFALNDKWMKVKGVCLHHDAGVLGAVVPAEVWRHRLEELKSIGVNAIRMSHNPQAPVLYDLCDELGFLVMDEASDEWEFPKRKWLEGWNRGKPGFEGTFDFFEEWIDRDVADMVRRDRNHPSVFLWSIGNEVDYPNDPYSHPILDGDGKDFTQPMYGGYKPDQPNAERIGKIAKRLSAIVRGIDNSRAVTGALAGVVMSNQTEYPEAIDVVGYNYTESRYAEDHAKYPKRIIYGSENRHDLAAWKAVRDNEHIFGQFLWTGADYLGESGAWPARGSSAGLIDLASQRKPNGWYRASLWSEKPVVYIGTYPLNNRGGRNAGRQGRRNNFISTYAADTWNYRDGQQIRVVCFTNQPDVRLSLNGQPVGGEAKLDSTTNVRYWDIAYQPGTLRAESGTASYEIRTSGLPYALRVTQEKSEGSVATDEKTAKTYILTIEVVDEQGNLVRLADNDITCMVVGNGHLLGLENGNMSDTSGAVPLRGGIHRRANQGRLVAYVQEGPGMMQMGPNFNQRQQNQEGANFQNGQNGNIRVRVSSPLLQDAEIVLE